jgi:hypothetical protein
MPFIEAVFLIKIKKYGERIMISASKLFLFKLIPNKNKKFFSLKVISIK